MRARLPVSLVVMTLTALPATALAQQVRAGVASFTGRRASAVQRRVRREARDHFDVSPRARSRRETERQGVIGTSETGVAELAEALDVDIVIQGHVEGRGRRAEVQIVVRDETGDEIAQAELGYPRGRRARRAFTATVEELFVRVADTLRERDAEPEEPEAPIADPIDDVEEPPRPGPTDGLAIVRATVGVVGRLREASIDLADGGRRGYASGLYPELHLALEARPLANETDAARGLYLRAAFAHSLGLGSQTSDGSVTVETTNFVRFDVDAGYLIAVEDVEIGLGFGFAYDGYHLAANTILPSAEYLVLRPHARARIRLLGDETFVLGIEAAYRGVLGRGGLSDAFGAEGDTHGIDVGATLGGNLLVAADAGFTYGVGVSYVGYFLSFAGAAADAPATGGYEAHLRLLVELGWSFN